MEKPSVYTAEYIKIMLATDTKWLYRGIVAIYKKQTDDEQAVQETMESNGVGFNSCDAKRLSQYAQEILHTGKLSERNRIVARQIMLKYAGQLARIANNKN